MDPQQRINSLTDYLKSDPTNPHLIGDLVDLYFQVGPLSKAKELLDKGLKFDPDNNRLKFQSATASIADGEYQTASSILSELLEAGLHNTGVLYNLSLSLAMQGEMEKAHQHLTDLRANPENRFIEGEVLYLRSLHHLTKLDDALELGLELLKKYGDNGDLCGAVSLIYLDQENTPLARHYAEQAQQLKPTNPESLATLGTISLEDMDTHIAIPYFDKILDAQPNDGRAWLGKGLAALLNQELEEGERCLVKATQNMPSHLGSWNSLAWVRISKGDIEGAEEATLASMEQDRTFSENHGTLAVIRILQEDLEPVENLIKVALRLDPNCFSALFAKTLLLNPQSDQQELQRQFTTLLNMPISDDGATIQKGLQKYSTKFTPKGNITKH